MDIYNVEALLESCLALGRSDPPPTPASAPPPVEDPPGVMLPEVALRGRLAGSRKGLKAIRRKMELRAKPSSWQGRFGRESLSTDADIIQMQEKMVEDVENCLKLMVNHQKDLRAGIISELIALRARMDRVEA